jgi:hypothetical protein
LGQFPRRKPPLSTKRLENNSTITAYKQRNHRCYTVTRCEFDAWHWCHGMFLEYHSSVQYNNWSSGTGHVMA